MSQPRQALPCTLRAELDASQLPWDLRRARRHWQVILAGRQVLVLPYNAEAGRRKVQANAMAALRRAIRAVSLEQKTGAAE